MPDVVEDEALAEVRIRPEPDAPWLHTMLILVVLALWASYGMAHMGLPSSAHSRGVTYTSGIVLEYLIVGSTIAGLYHRRRFILSVFGTPGVRDICADLGWGFLIFLCGLAVMVVLGTIARPFHPQDNRAVLQALRPHSSAELALWMLVSLSAGVCEEFVFRGYLLQQLTHWCGSIAVAVGVSALLFGCMHLYEGTAAAVQICGLGALFAIFAVRRGNLRSVMVAHVLQDVFTGLVLYLRN